MYACTITLRYECTKCSIIPSSINSSNSWLRVKGFMTHVWLILIVPVNRFTIDDEFVHHFRYDMHRLRSSDWQNKRSLCNEQYWESNDYLWCCHRIYDVRWQYCLLHISRWRSKTVNKNWSRLAVKPPTIHTIIVDIFFRMNSIENFTTRRQWQPEWQTELRLNVKFELFQIYTDETR